MTRVLAIPGSLRRDSLNADLARAVADAAPDGVTVDVWDGLRAIPPYDADEDHPGAHAVVDAFRALVAAYDAVVFVTPEYNASVPGQLKNAVDWLSRPFPGNALYGKPVAVVGASTGQFGGIWAQDDLRKILRITGARVLGDGLAVAKAGDAFLEGRLVDPEHAAALTGILEALVREARPVA